MGKRKVSHEVEKETVKEILKKEEDIIEFIQDFKGQLNNKKFNAKKGDMIQVLPFQIEWLKRHGAIE